ncbi:putative peroxidase [Podospora fimiseda]|uniref:Peroxidase n=1 Tax=Podospora fimiseda TaxID=252190 RepID=A0AAN7H6E2_9PEZI|nr:putative peroxidase [Podospora fimiseda]
MSSPSPPKGEYSPRPPSSLRSPCPLLNSLANHGYLPRSGRDFTQSDLSSALSQAGLSPILRAILSSPVFLEYHNSKSSPPSKPKKSLLNPWSLLFSFFGMRDPNQFNSSGVPVLNLDQIAREGIAEHDISLTRLDRSQGDFLAAQPGLVQELLAISNDGKYITLEDLAALRKRRIEKRMSEDPDKITYGSREHRISCTEIALVLCVFGDGKRVPLEYIRAIFEEERLPTKEGWEKRGGWWWGTLGLKELGSVSKTVREVVEWKAVE